LACLISAKVDVNIRDQDTEKDPRYISKSREDDSNQHRTALHYAAEFGNATIVRMLLEAGAAINERDGEQMTPLHVHMAASKEEDGLEVGAGVRVHGLKSRPEWNQLMGSVIGPSASSETGIVRWPVLLEGREEGVLLKAENLSRVFEESLDLLLEARADVNMGNLQWPQGHTMLHEVANVGDVDLAGKIIAAGGSINAKDAKLGMTPLHLACRSKREEMIRFLVNARADLFQQTASGKTAAELGQTNGLRREMMALLHGEVNEVVSPQVQTKASAPPQLLNSISPEQRALLFID